MSTITGLDCQSTSPPPATDIGLPDNVCTTRHCAGSDVRAGFGGRGKPEKQFIFDLTMLRC